MSNDLGFDFARAAPWFRHAQESPYVLVRVRDEHAKSWADRLSLTVRRCYVSDSTAGSLSLPEFPASEYLLCTPWTDSPLGNSYHVSHPHD